MSRKFSVGLVCVIMGAVLFAGCNNGGTQHVALLREYPVDNEEGVVGKSWVIFDRKISSDGNGSLRINVDSTTAVRLYETGNLEVENAKLTYQAKLKTEGITGRVYLEMWCQFDGQGEYFARDLGTPIEGDVEWATEEVSFVLKRGQNPDNIKLNIIIDGSGRVWVDDIKLFKGPLR